MRCSIIIINSPGKDINPLLLLLLLLLQGIALFYVLACRLPGDAWSWGLVGPPLWNATGDSASAFASHTWGIETRRRGGRIFLCMVISLLGCAGLRRDNLREPGGHGWCVWMREDVQLDDGLYDVRLIACCREIRSRR
jgi:hypothetical protein